MAVLAAACKATGCNLQPADAGLPDLTPFGMWRKVCISCLGGGRPPKAACSSAGTGSTVLVLEVVCWQGSILHAPGRKEGCALGQRCCCCQVQFWLAQVEGRRCHWWLMPPMKVRGLGASPLNFAPEKSKPGCCTQQDKLSRDNGLAAILSGAAAAESNLSLETLQHETLRLLLLLHRIDLVALEC